MTTIPTRPDRGEACDAARVHRLLGDELSARERETVELHIEGCPTCRRELQTAAAGPDWWRSAGEYLRDDPDDLESLSELLDTQPSPRFASPALVLAQLAPTDEPRMLGRLGAYEIAGVVGCGGMSVVLKGYDPSLARYVAIKVLAPHLATSGAARRRFAREAQAAAAVAHEHVIAIHSVAESQGLPYLVMPYVRGPSLQRRLDDEGPLGVEETLRIGRQIAAGLGAAHEQGLVHRDIKPGNILLESGVERVAITDFGLARTVDDASLTRSGVIAGTPQYMSPEQARGEAVDHRSDLFSLGAVLYTLCAGHPPFRAETAMAVLHRICSESPRSLREWNPHIPEWLERLVLWLLEKQPERRPESAAEVARLLADGLAHLQHPQSRPLPPPLLPPRTRQRPRSLVRIGGVAALVGLAGFACASPWLFQLGAADSRAQEERTAGQLGEQASKDLPPSNVEASASSATEEWTLESFLEPLRQEIEQLEEETGVAYFRGND